MKVIDLLVKIANKEEVPKTIMWGDLILVWDERDYHDYMFVDTGNHLLFNGFATSVLDQEVVIIEEKPKKIEELEDIKECFAGVEIEYNENAPQYKINQLIRNQKNIAKAVNYLLEKESDK